MPGVFRHSLVQQHYYKRRLRLLGVGASAPTPITGDVQLTSTITGTIHGDGLLTGLVEPAFAITGTIYGNGVLTGLIEPAFDVTGTIHGNGFLTGLVDILSTVTGDILGEGLLTSTLLPSVDITGDLDGIGELTGLVESTVDITSTIDSIGVLTGLVDNISDITGTISGAGILTTTIDNTTDVIGSITGDGFLTGLVDNTTTVIGTITTNENITTTVSVDFIITSTLTDKAPLVLHNFVTIRYVAPYDGGSGPGTSDLDTQDETAYDNATSELTPCTIGCALTYASAGHVIELAPGIYTGAASDNRWVGTFEPSISGTADNPIIFVAKYPAAWNQENFTTFEHTGSTHVTGGPAFGTAGEDYIVWDGIHVHEANALVHPDTATAVITGGSIGCHIQRCRLRGIDADYVDNHSAIRMENFDYATIRDNHLKGFHRVEDNNHNGSAIISYGNFVDTTHSVIENNYITDCDGGIFIKGEPYQRLVITTVTQATQAVVTTNTAHDLVVGDWVHFIDITTGMAELAGHAAEIVQVNSSTQFVVDHNTSAYTAYQYDALAEVRGIPFHQSGYQITNNHITNCNSNGIQIYAHNGPNTTLIKSNLIDTVGFGLSIGTGFQKTIPASPSNSNPQGIIQTDNVLAENNTVVNCQTSLGHYVSDDMNNVIIRNNISYNPRNGIPYSYHYTDRDPIASDADRSDADYNCYYSNISSVRWRYGSSNVGSLVDYRTYVTPWETNSFDTDPEFVSPSATAEMGDYRLQNNAQDALTGSNVNGPVGAYITGDEIIGIRTGTPYFSGQVLPVFTVTGSLQNASTDAIIGLVENGFTVTGNLIDIGYTPITGLIESDFTVTGTIYGNGILSGDIQLTSGIIGTIHGNGALTGNISVLGTITGTPTDLGSSAITGLVDVITTITGTGDLIGILTSTLTSLADITGTITGEGTLTTTLGITSGITGTLTETAENNIIGLVNITSAITGDISETGYIPGTVNITTQVQGSCTDANANQLQSTITVSSTVTGDINGIGYILGSITESATVTGTGDLIGALDTTIGINTLITSEIGSDSILESTVGVSTTVTSTLTGIGSPATGVVNIQTHIAGAILDDSTIISEIYYGLVDISVSVTGTLQGTGVLDTTIPVTSNVIPIIFGTIDAVGNIPITTTVSAVGETYGVLEGSIVANGDIVGSPSGIGVIESTIPNISTIIGDAVGNGVLGSLINGDFGINGSMYVPLTITNKGIYTINDPQDAIGINIPQGISYIHINQDIYYE